MPSPPQVILAFSASNALNYRSSRAALRLDSERARLRDAFHVR